MNVCLYVCVLVDDIDAVKVSIKLATNGKAYVRRFRSTDLVKSIFAAAAAAADVTDKSFDVLTSYPTRSLSDDLDGTIGASGLANCQVIMRWI